MPSFTNSNGVASKFQLPALDLKFGSLTEGTDIPPPLPSPVQEEPPVTVATTTTQPAADVAKPTTATNGTQTSPEAKTNGLKRSAEDATPASPTSTKAPASIRRLFSRHRLNDALYANEDAHLGEALVPRPISQSNASISTDKQSKRSSGWFRRLRGSDGLDSRRSSRIFVPIDGNSKPVPTTPKSLGPPPPMIPEFKALGSKVDLSDDGGSLGSDLFKDIK